MEHEISAVQVLHHKEKVRLQQKVGVIAASSTHVGLEGAEEVAEEGVFHAQRQNLPLNHRALDVIVLQNRIFLKRLIVNIKSGDENQVP